MVSGDRIRERTRHPSQEMENEPDGGIILTIQVADLWEVNHWRVGFGSQGQVLEPIELRREITRECAAAALSK